MDEALPDAELLEGVWHAAAQDMIHSALPPVCPRPGTLLELPAAIFAHPECFRATLSLFVGLSIVLFAGVVKLPQIATIVGNKSVAGLSGMTFLVETFGYTYNLAAHYRQRYPVSTYGDFAVLIVENYYIIYLFYHYTGRGQRGVAVVAGFFGLLVVLCSPVFPVEMLRLMTLGNIPVVVLGRTPQVYANYVNGGTGALSIVTCWGIFLGASARIFTTLQDVDSVNILLGYLVSAILNGIIAFQVAYYRFVKPPIAKEDKIKKAA